jgi:hypothetical protein
VKTASAVRSQVFVDGTYLQIKSFIRTYYLNGSDNIQIYTALVIADLALWYVTAATFSILLFQGTQAVHCSSEQQKIGRTHDTCSEIVTQAEKNTLFLGCYKN